MCCFMILSTFVGITNQYKKCCFALLVILCITLALMVIVSLGLFIVLKYIATSTNITNITLGTLYGNQTMLLVSYGSSAVSIDVIFDTMETSSGPISIDVYKSRQLLERIFEPLPTKNLSDRYKGRRYNYNYVNDETDEPIFLQSGSTINYTLYSENTCHTNTTTPAPDTCTSLYLFNNHKDYDAFRNKKYDSAEAISSCARTDTFVSLFKINHDSLYYVALQTDGCHNVKGSVSVTQASYNSSGLNQVCGLLNSSRKSCSINLCDNFFGCSEAGYIFATIPEGKTLKEIGYMYHYRYYYNYIFVAIFIYCFDGLLILICAFCYQTKYLRKCSPPNVRYRSLNNNDDE